MRSARLSWQQVCALLAIVTGLAIAGTCWADTTWPDSVNPQTPITGVCNAASYYCVILSTCENRGTGDPLPPYTCDNTAWTSRKRMDQRQYGTCASARTGSCTAYDTFYCAWTQIYKLPNCNAGDEACQHWVTVGNACDPNNP